jgi:hypothetical protein
MEKLVFAIVSLFCFVFGSVDAVSVLDQRTGTVYQFSEPNQQKKAPTHRDYYDSWGRHQGYSEKESFGNRTNHYDAWGRQEGYSEKNFMGEVNHYDSYGRFQGTTKDR